MPGINNTNQNFCVTDVLFPILQALEQLKQEIGPMKKKVASFHDLPPVS